MLNYRSIGEGRPIFVLHGVTLDHRYMMDILEPVFQSTDGWQRIYVDYPGHGESPARDDICSQDDLLAAVIAFADEVLGDRRFALVGLSRGSYLARGIVHLMPQRVTGAALIVPGGNPSSDPTRLPPHELLVPDPTLAADLAEDEIWAHENLSVVQRRDIIEKRRQVIRPAREKFDAAQDARVMQAFDFSFSAEEEATPFDGPSLIVAGRQDSISGYLDAVDLMHRYRRATLAVLDTAGHGLAWERPEVFCALVSDWLARLLASSATQTSR